ncbi:hypothetical protein SEPCBS57363_005008 [Sporothrix epigloea]|uniref:Uncharacterized protein n=1 Tax=Sporothrix epigloea TaxID=1892477 RepID=A0ABP0DVC3_9PEZI
MTRTLTRQENYRLRRALYNWMRFAYYFHGDLPRPSLSFPLGNDVRLNQLRALPNSELGELRDLWRTVEDIVELEICPSIANVRIGADFELSEKDVAQIGWGERAENRIVVSTVTKLSPEELLHYLDNRHKFTKQRLIQDIRQRHPQIESDMNSLTVALACVNRERWLHMLVTFPAYQPSTGGLYLPIYTRTMGQYRGGILNWDDPAIEAECAAVGEMTGLGLDWRPEPRSRAILQPGLLDP